MGIETSVTITGLNEAWPLGTDPRAEGDNHLRLVKSVLKLRFDDATANELKLKNTIQLTFLSGTTARGKMYWGTGASGNVRLALVNNAGTDEGYIDGQAGGLTSRGNGTQRELALSNLAGSQYQMRLVWTDTGQAQMLAYNTGGVLADAFTIAGQNSYSTARVAWLNDTRVAGDTRMDMWVGADKRMLWLATANSDFYLIRSNASGNASQNLMIVGQNGDIRTPIGAFVCETVTKGLMVPAAGNYGVLAGTAIDGANLGTSPQNNVELATWWGFGVKDYNGVVRWTVDARTGTTKQYGPLILGNSTVWTDGNISFAGTMANFGSYLSDALGQRAVINTQTATGATGFPLGTILMMYTNGVAVVRNSLTNPCLSNNDSIYYRLQGQANAGTRLDGNWRACGHIDSNWVCVQRVP